MVRDRRCGLSPLVLFALPLACLVGTGVLAQPEPPLYVYTLNATGKVSVNGTVLDNLDSDFDEDTMEGIDTSWADLAVVGSDRYVIRRDGRLLKNGAKFDNLPFDEGIVTYNWVRISVAGGVVYSLRQDGRLAADDEEVADLPEGEFLFTDIVATPDGKTYSLRSDGNVYQSGSSDPIYKFRAPKGVYGGDDGEEQDTVWFVLRLNPADGSLFALRTDGYIYRGVLPPLTGDDEDEDGEEITRLPFTGDLPLELQDLYVNIKFLDAGGWRALRSNGEVYADFRPLSPLVDLPGNASDYDNIYTDLALFGEDFWSLRSDGSVYRNTDETPVGVLSGDGYVRITISTEPPDLSNFKNQKPVAAKYTTTTLVGTPLSVPVVVTDVDKVSQDLVVTPTEPLPPGSVWDPNTRTLDWEAPGPAGTYKFSYEVNDGVNKPVKFQNTLKIKDVDSKPDKNKKPYLCKIQKAQALAGYEYTLPIIVDDPDGDPVSVSVDTSTYPFNRGATFNPATITFSWTPQFDDLGKVTVQFIVTDGIETVALKVQVEVVNSLIFTTTG